VYSAKERDYLTDSRRWRDLPTCNAVYKAIYSLPRQPPTSIDYVVRQEVVECERHRTSWVDDAIEIAINGNCSENCGKLTYASGAETDYSE